jgi:hypothetical protein
MTWTPGPGKETTRQMDTKKKRSSIKRLQWEEEYAMHQANNDPHNDPVADQWEVLLFLAG